MKAGKDAGLKSVLQTTICSKTAVKSEYPTEVNKLRDAESELSGVESEPRDAQRRLRVVKTGKTP